MAVQTCDGSVNCGSAVLSPLAAVAAVAACHQQLGACFCPRCPPCHAKGPIPIALRRAPLCRATHAHPARSAFFCSGASPERQYEGRTAAEVAQLKGFSATANLIRMMAQKPPPAPTEPDVDSKSTDASGGTPLRRGPAADRSQRQQQAAAAKLALVKKQLSEADAEGKWASAQKQPPLMERAPGSAPAILGPMGQLGTGPSWEAPRLPPAVPQPAGQQLAGQPWAAALSQGSEDVVPELPTPAMVRQTSKDRREASRAALVEQQERERLMRQAAREEAERRRTSESAEHRQQLEGLVPAGARGSGDYEQQYAALAAAAAGRGTPPGSGRGTPPPSGSSLAGLPSGLVTPSGLGDITPGSVTPAGASSGAVTPTGRSGGLSRQHSGPEQGQPGAEMRGPASLQPGNGGSASLGGSGGGAASGPAEEAALHNFGSGSGAVPSQPPSLPLSRSYSGGAAEGGEPPHPSITNSAGSGSSSICVNRWAGQ